MSIRQTASVSGDMCYVEERARLMGHSKTLAIVRTIGIKASIKQKLTILISAPTSKLIPCDSAWACRSADV